MNFLVPILLFIEAAFAYWLLCGSGNLKSRSAIMLSAILLALAFALRAICLDYVTLDYSNFLKQWVEFFRQNGGFAALKYSVGNYNIPYLYFLAFFSYLSIDDLYLIKLLSIFFDVLLAWSAMGIVKKLGGKAKAQLGCFFVVMFLPTVVLNGALWGQCDSIYVALALMSIYYALDDKPVRSVLAITLSFGFKLQAIFIMPVLAVLLMQNKLKLKHFLIFPVAYVLLVLPAVLIGRPFMDTITLYFNQTGSIGSGLNYNSSSIFAIFWNVQNEEFAANIAIIAAAVFMFAVLLLCLLRRKQLSDKAVILAAVLFAVGIPFFLPHMHDRYFFASDILTVVLSFIIWQFSPAALLAQFASLLGYHAYLMTRYLLPMRYGAYGLIVVMLLALCLLIYQLYGENSKNSNFSLDKS